MGLAMATNIQKYLRQHNLPPLKYWNRTLSRGDDLKDIGGTSCRSIADLVQSCDVIFISVSSLLDMKKFVFFFLVVSTPEKIYAVVCVDIKTHNSQCIPAEYLFGDGHNNLPGTSISIRGSP
jgi:3-hydroxyisobutyrate dehydrogenase-like beta-hydroxyacid dehydrogenase